MAAPTIESQPDDPVMIDPGVAYTYVIPVQEETSIGFEPHDDFTLALSGRVLTLTYIGDLVTAAADIDLTIYASNADGTTEQTLTVQIKPSPQLTCQLTEGNANILFGTDVATFFTVGDLVTFVLPAGSGLSEATLSSRRSVYVVAVSSPNIQVSLTPGGAAITASIAGAPTISEYYVYPNSYARAFPVISSASTLSAARGAAVNYTITADLTPDGYFAKGLPNGLSISSNVISGNAPLEAGFYPIILQAYKLNTVLTSTFYSSTGASTKDPTPAISSRYLLLTVTE